MPRVRMVSLSAGPSGVRQPGREYDVSEREAEDLVKGRYAYLVDPRFENEESIETATREAPENAAGGPQRKRRG